METFRTHRPVELTPGTTITRIVVPVLLDHRYDRGVAFAATLAERFGLPVQLISVDLSGDDSVPLDIGDRMEAMAAAARAAYPAVDFGDEVIGAADHPAAAFAESLADSDLPVMATEAMEGPAGSFAQEAVSLAPGPMLLLGPEATQNSLEGDVVVAVDGSVLAERIVPAGRGLAEALGARIKLVQVVPSDVTSHIETLKAKGEHVSESVYLRDLRARLDDSAIGWEIVHDDDPARVLCAQSHVAAIAMATHGREGFVAAVLGSVTLTTVRHATCPVLVQHPTNSEDTGELVLR